MHEFLIHDYFGIYIIVSVILFVCAIYFAPRLMNFLDKVAAKKNKRESSLVEKKDRYKTF